MMYRTLGCLFAALALAAFCTVASAEERKAASDTTIGQFVKADAGQLTVKVLATNGEGKEVKLPLASTVKVTFSGKEGKIEDIKAGTSVVVKVNADGKVVLINASVSKGPGSAAP